MAGDLPRGHWIEPEGSSEGNQWPVLLSRLDFGWITKPHILYPPLTIGLAALLFFSEFYRVRSGNDHG